MLVRWKSAGPSASAARKPKTRSAAAFQYRTVPVRSQIRMASGEPSNMRSGRSFGSADIDRLQRYRPTHFRIDDLDSVDLGPRRQRVRPRPNAAGDLAHRYASHEESVRDQRTMTPPWDRLRAHQDDVVMSCEIDTSVQTSSECRRLHVVRIPAEARIPPSTVDGASPRVSQSPQTGHVRVPNAGAA